MPNLIMAYTTEKPAEPPLPPTQGVIDRTKLKFARLIQGSIGKGGTATEEFLQDEVSALVSVLSKPSSIYSLASLSIKNGALNLAFSWSLQTVEDSFQVLRESVPPLASSFPKLQSRYLIGVVDFVPEIIGGVLRITITKLTLNNQPVPTLLIRQCNRLINSLLSGANARIPMESSGEATYKRIPLETVTGIELKKDSLLLTFTGIKTPTPLPLTPKPNSHQAK